MAAASTKGQARRRLWLAATNLAGRPGRAAQGAAANDDAFD